MLLGEEALCAFAGDFVDGIDEQDFASSCLGLMCPANDHAGFHGRVVEEVWTKAQYAFDQVSFDELAPHFGFLLPKEDTMGPQDGAAPGLGFEACENMLLKGVISATLRRCAVEIAPPWVGRKRIAVPLLDRVRRISEYDIELHESVAFDKFGLCKRVASLDPEVLDAMEKAIHAGD